MNTEEESELRGFLNFTIIVFQTMGGGEEHVTSNLQEKVLRKMKRFFNQPGLLHSWTLQCQFPLKSVKDQAMDVRDPEKTVASVPFLSISPEPLSLQQS